MKWVQILGVLLIIAGGIWILQGFSLIPQGNILSRSFMMGNKQWALYGGIAAFTGLLMFFLGSRKRV